MGGSQKGSSFERDLARAFSLWFSEGSADDLFWRTSGSGARATRRETLKRPITKYQYGDMTYARPEGKPLVEWFNFEFKRYHQIDVLSVLYPVCCKQSLLAFWAKCVSEAESSGRIPMLVTRVDQGQCILWMPVSLSVLLSAKQHPVRSDNTLWFQVPATEVVLKKVYPPGKTKGKAKSITYTFSEPQKVMGVPLDAFFHSVLGEALVSVCPFASQVIPKRSTGAE